MLILHANNFLMLSLIPTYFSGYGSSPNGGRAHCSNLCRKLLDRFLLLKNNGQINYRAQFLPQAPNHYKHFLENVLGNMHPNDLEAGVVGSHLQKSN